MRKFFYIQNTKTLLYMLKGKSVNTLYNNTHSIDYSKYYCISTSSSYPLYAQCIAQCVMVLELCENNQKRLCSKVVKKYRFLLGAITFFHQTVAVSLDNRDFTIQEYYFRIRI